jgi:ribonuclease E/ribonuclease G
VTGRELLAQRFDAGLIALILQDGRLDDIAVDRDDLPRIGTIHLARVDRLVTKMRAAFVELGDGTTGLLRASDLRPRPPTDADIGTVLRAGQTVLVQVRAIKPGDKAPAVSMDITLPGRFLVHLPLGRGISVSRRIGDPAERTRLAAMAGLGEGGWIIRAKAATASPEEINIEGATLARHWGSLAGRLRELSAPVPLREAPNAALRLLIDNPGPPERVEIADPDARREVERWAADFAVRLNRQSSASVDADLFTLRDLHEDIAALLRPAVPLPSGGMIMIEPTAALTAIDVDSGARSTPLQANLEAAQEIARQIRLRHIGGIVVIDFITMRREQERKNLLSALAKAVSQDGVPTHLYGMSALGLVELARERRGLPLSDLLQHQTE